MPHSLTPRKIRISSIIVPSFYPMSRLQKGVAKTAESIRQHGLHTPVVLNRRRLCDGGIRMAACRVLGWTTIDYTTTDVEPSVAFVELNRQQHVTGAQFLEMFWNDPGSVPIAKRMMYERMIRDEVNRQVIEMLVQHNRSERAIVLSREVLFKCTASSRSDRNPATLVTRSNMIQTVNWLVNRRMMILVRRALDRNFPARRIWNHVRNDTPLIDSYH